MIGVITDLRGQVKGDREASLSPFEQIVITAIAFCRSAKASILTHGPEPPAVHIGLHPARKRIVTWEAKLFLVAGIISRRIERFHRNRIAAGGKAGTPFPKALHLGVERLLLPLLYLRGEVVGDSHGL